MAKVKSSDQTNWERYKPAPLKSEKGTARLQGKSITTKDVHKRNFGFLANQTFIDKERTTLNPTKKYKVTKLNISSAGKQIKRLLAKLDSSSSRKSKNNPLAVQENVDKVTQERKKKRDELFKNAKERIAKSESVSTAPRKSAEKIGQVTRVKEGGEIFLQKTLADGRVKRVQLSNPEFIAEGAEAKVYRVKKFEIVNGNVNAVGTKVLRVSKKIVTDVKKHREITSEGKSPWVLKASSWMDKNDSHELVFFKDYTEGNLADVVKKMHGKAPNPSELAPWDIVLGGVFFERTGTAHLDIKPLNILSIIPKESSHLTKRRHFVFADLEGAVQMEKLTRNDLNQIKQYNEERRKNNEFAYPFPSGVSFNYILASDYEKLCKIVEEFKMYSPDSEQKLEEYKKTLKQIDSYAIGMILYDYFTGQIPSLPSPKESFHPEDILATPERIDMKELHRRKVPEPFINAIARLTNPELTGKNSRATLDEVLSDLKKAKFGKKFYTDQQKRELENMFAVLDEIAPPLK